MPLHPEAGEPRLIERRHIEILAAATVLACILMSAVVSAHAQEQTLPVTIRQGAAAVTNDATFTADVVTTLPSDTDYLEVRLRIKRPSGRLLYQKTEVRHAVPAGQAVVSFTRTLRDLSLTPGRYPIEVRVLASGASPTAVTSRMLVIAPDTPRVPVAVVVRLRAVPSVDPSGRFTIDPEVYPRPRTDAERILDVIRRHPSIQPAIAIPPLIIDEWHLAADGYEVVGPEGVRSVGADAPLPIACTRLLERLTSALRADALELLDVPYADPDLVALARAGALDDLDRHFALADAFRASSLEATPSKGAAFARDLVPAQALPILERRGLSYVLCSPASATADEATPTSGVYALERSSLRALVTDTSLADAAERGDEDAFLDAIFERAISAEPDVPIIVAFDIGAGTRHTAAGFERALEMLERAPFVSPTSARAAAARPIATEMPSLVLRSAPPAPTPPGDHVARIAESRIAALAVADALGADDPDARSAIRSILVAESAQWAGPDDRYALADRSVAYVEAARAIARRIFSSIAIQPNSVTLSNQYGDVPVAVTNGGDRALRVRVLLSPRKTMRVERYEFAMTLERGENVIQVPVDMGGELTDELDVTILAGELPVARATIPVRASYLDRLVTLAIVVAFLLGLLFFIRRRVAVAEDDTTAPTDEGDGRTPRPIGPR